MGSPSDNVQTALEARRHDIRVNSVSPGFLLTKLLDPFMAKGDGQLAGKVWEEYEARQGRKATFDEVGDVVVLLSLPRMSLVVGHNLVIDGYVDMCLLLYCGGVHCVWLFICRSSSSLLRTRSTTH